MQPSSPHQGRQAHVPQPAASSSVSASGQWPQVELNNRLWTLSPLVEELVRRCPICIERLARRHICAQMYHCVCTPCYEDMVRTGEPLTCPQCRAPAAASCVVQQKDLELGRMLPLTELFCVECDNWKGPATSIEGHIAVCGQREHSCPQARQGCDWKGTASALRLHEPDCAWVPKVCSHPGCQESVFSGTQKAHEENCGHRPVNMGALRTTAAEEQRLREICQFYRQGAGELEKLAPPQLRTRVLQAAEFVPRLCDAVEAAVSTDIMENCPWGCGFSSPRSLMEGHYPHCQKLPVDCQFCTVKIAREMVEIHAGICDERLVPCPRGCSERGVRFQEIESGLHERICPEKLTQCPDCNTDMVRRELGRHQQSCVRRRAPCGWCMETHATINFESVSNACRRRSPVDPRIPNHPYVGQHPLRLASSANGAVYIRPDRGYRCVYIYLPASVLRQEMGPHGTGRNLTEAVSFMWDQQAYSRVAVRYQPDTRCFTVGVSTALPFGNAFKFEAKLYGHDAGWRWLETMGEIDERRNNEKLLEMRLGETLNEGRITVYNQIVSREDDGFFLQLGPVHVNR